MNGTASENVAGVAEKNSMNLLKARQVIFKIHQAFCRNLKTFHNHYPKRDDNNVTRYNIIAFHGK